jgi:hypothetical protein
MINYFKKVLFNFYEDSKYTDIYFEAYLTDEEWAAYCNGDDLKKKRL